MAIAWGIDDHLKTPYSEVVDFSITREFAHNFVLEATYTGRFAHRLLQEVDLAQPLNLVDPKSGTRLFPAAAQMFAKAACRGSARRAITSVPAFPTGRICFRRQRVAGLLSGNDSLLRARPDRSTDPTATQNMYDVYLLLSPAIETTAQEIADVFCFPACVGHRPRRHILRSAARPYQYYQDQFSSLYAWQTRSNSNYNALQMTVCVTP